MISQITPIELKRKLDAGEPLYLVDVRNPDEYAFCRLAESVLIPLHELAGRVEEVQPPVGATIVVYCHHGVRSLRGAMLLMQAGHENVVSLAGGIEAWSQTVDPAVPRY